jgi:hypothetical protein
MGYSKKSDLFSVGGLRLGVPEKTTKNVFKKRRYLGILFLLAPRLIGWLQNKRPLIAG